MCLRIQPLAFLDLALRGTPHFGKPPNHVTMEPAERATLETPLPAQAMKDRSMPEDHGGRAFRFRV